jgi:uncharacterized protein
MGFFSRRKRDRSSPALRLYYASDIHGTEVLWRKFLAAGTGYDAKVLVMGGDVTGKAVVPLVTREGGTHVELFGEHRVLTDSDAVEEMENRIRANGMYPHHMTQDDLARVRAMSDEEREQWFGEVMRETFASWLALADERLEEGTRCFVMPGNDDPPGIDAAIESAASVEACDDRVVEFDGYSMLSLGYSNPTPFGSPRELSEEHLCRRIEALAEQVPDMGRAIFNLHVPPHDSSLDTAPALTEDLEVVMSGSAPKLIPVGSTAVREAIERFQPMLTLHGHVHESPGIARIGRTLCINPGSDYHTGRIAGCLIGLRDEVPRHQFVTG